MAIQTPDQRVRVFISSTMKELAAERAAVAAAVRRLHLTPVLFELGARPHPPKDLYLAYLRQSHVFLGIYAEEYGWVAPGEEVSGIEDEYLAAAGLPKLIYVRRPAPQRAPRLTEMLDRMRSAGLSYRSFGSARELAALVAEDLAVLLSERFAAGQPVEPPPVGTPDVPDGPAWHLPAPTSSFVGRQAELEQLRSMMGDPTTRLVTLTGPGGIGKTRLALRVTADLAGRFPDGTAAIMLGSLRSADLVPGVIMTALGVPGSSGRSPAEALADYLRPRNLLLLLDNVEHVMGAVPFLAELLSAAPGLRLLVTSREVLRLSGERVFDVPPLPVPGGEEPPEAAGRAEALELFLDRARAARRDLLVDDALLETAGQICRRLEGLPLALELAAARVRVLEPAEIARRLDDRLSLLTDGPRDVPTRQQTLREAIRWSYDLLDEREAWLFRRLSVFANGFSLQAAEAVCAGAAEPGVLAVLTSLVDKSLLRPSPAPGQPARFAMLETIRDFAEQQAVAAGELTAARDAHADYFTGLVLRNAPGWDTGEEERLTEAYDTDTCNLWAALHWLAQSGRPGRVATGAFALWRYWWVRGAFAVGIATMHQILERTAELTDEEHARTQFVLGMLAFGHADHALAAPALRAAIGLHERIGDERSAAIARIATGFLEAFAGRPTGPRRIGRALVTLRRLHDDWGLSFALFALGRIHAEQGRVDEAVPLLEEAVERARAVPTQMLLSFALINLGWAHLGRGALPEARPPLEEALRLALRLDNRPNVARALESLAAVALGSGERERAAHLFGAAEGARRSVGVPVWLPDRAAHDRLEQGLRAALGEAGFAAASRAGVHMRLAEAAWLAVAGGDEQPTALPEPVVAGVAG